MNNPDESWDFSLLNISDKTFESSVKILSFYK